MRKGIDFRPLLELMFLMIAGMISSVLLIQFLFKEIDLLAAENRPVEFLISTSISLIFSFGLPAVIWLKWRGNLVEQTGKKSTKILSYIASSVLFFSLIFFSDYFTNWFSQFLELRGWVDLTDEAFNILSVKSLLKHENLFPFVLFAVAVIPAVVEEFFFRRIIFTYLLKSSGTFWVPAILSALFFSGMHNHFISFFPIFLLGLGLAFSYYTTNSIWTPIILHACNNALSIILLRFDSDNQLSAHWFVALIAALLSIFIFQKMLSKPIAANDSKSEIKH